ncbi:interferon alpha/beta receptor 1 [Elgaria multicarinata webbii]|uniref:interferon alpha/beta receptor 1 n=1 Tax=Elgaria multicarinata webbii TaxID=159646 RepID=UPI002FCCBD95
MKVARALLVAAAALGAARPCTGLICMPEPQNVTIEVVNTNITLKWNWNNPCGLNVTFSAEKQGILDDEEILNESWSVISGCQNVTTTECDLSSAMLIYDQDYNVSIRAYTTTDHSPAALLTFCPLVNAQVGPPGVKFEFIYGDVKIIIISPEANQPRKMWETETFTYKLTIWKNSSQPQVKNQEVFSGQLFHDLEPETTYCLKVKAHLNYHISLYSRVYSVKTPKAWVGLPRPENVYVRALNLKYVLHWDNLYHGNVSFLVQYLTGYKARASPDISKEWQSAKGCKNISTTHCNLLPPIDFDGIYYLRVQAVHSHNKSPWSKMLRFEPKEDNEIGPPSIIKISPSEDSLTVFIASPGESENNSLSKKYDFTYHVCYWTDSSHSQEKIDDKPAIIISGLTASTSYCLKVQAHNLIYNKSSAFSNVTCIETANGKSFPTFVVFLIALAVVSVASLIYYIWRKIKYAFFPKCNPPMIIQSIEGKDVNSPYLLTSEELTENCVIVDSIPDEVNLVDSKAHKELEQISQDSGNYCNDDDISGNRESYKTLEQKAV